jgi:predicted acyltransferase
VLAILLGMIWNLFFPINKALWTSSFVLYAGGISTLGLALSYWFIDVLGHKKLIWPFLVFGTNAISAYILADIVPGLLDFIKFHNGKLLLGTLGYINQTCIVPFFTPINASLAFAVFFVVLIWVIMYPLYAKKVIIKV